MKKLIKKCLLFFGYNVTKAKYKKPIEKYLTAKFKINLNDFEIFGNDLFSKELNFLIQSKDFEILLDGYEFALKLKNVLGASFKYDENNRILCKLDKPPVNLYINSSEELFIIKEVFVDGIYNVILNDKEKIQLLDIGMNVGITSLFFAANPNVIKVIGFEPFPITFNFSQANFEINKSFSSKIQSYQHGISNHNSIQNWQYNLKHKGSIGLNGLGKNLHVPENSILYQNVEIIDIRDVFKMYINISRECTFIVKVDCEGSEYKIIEALSESALISNINILLIEWHFNGPDILLKILKQNGFRCLCFNSAADIGMIYAFSNRES